MMIIIFGMEMQIESVQSFMCAWRLRRRLERALKNIHFIKYTLLSTPYFFSVLTFESLLVGSANNTVMSTNLNPPI